MPSGGADGGGAKRQPVLIQVVPVAPGGEIAWGGSLTEQLEQRLDDIRNAIAAGASAVAESLPGLQGVKGWRVGQVEASFSVTVTAEAGVILSKASAGATFEVKVLYTRDP